MGRRGIPKPMFVIGDFVFAKVHGYRPWPARILGRYGSLSKLKYSVFFYGTCNTGKVASSHVFEFGKSQRSLGVLRSKNSVRNAEFRAAMAHVRQAFAKPEQDFVYYQVLARAEGNGENAVAYEVLAPTTESEEDTDSDEEDSEDSSSTVSLKNSEPKAKKHRIEPQGRIVVDSEKKLEKPQPAKKTVKSMPLLDEPQPAKKSVKSVPLLDEPQPAKTLKKSMPLLDELDAPDLGEVIAAPEQKQPVKQDCDKDLFSDTDSDDFEFEPNPIVRNSVLKDFENQGAAKQMSNSVWIPRGLGKPLAQLDEEDEDSELDGIGGYESDQPLNLSRRHITADEQ